MGVVRAVVLWLVVMAVIAVIRIIWDYVDKRRKLNDIRRETGHKKSDFYV